MSREKQEGERGPAAPEKARGKGYSHTHTQNHTTKSYIELYCFSSSSVDLSEYPRLRQSAQKAGGPRPVFLALRRVCHGGRARRSRGKGGGGQSPNCGTPRGFALEPKLTPKIRRGQSPEYFSSHRPRAEPFIVETSTAAGRTRSSECPRRVRGGVLGYALLPSSFSILGRVSIRDLCTSHVEYW